MAHIIDVTNYKWSQVSRIHGINQNCRGFIDVVLLSWHFVVNIIYLSRPCFTKVGKLPIVLQFVLEIIRWLRIGEAKPSHDEVIKWKHFPRYWPFVRGIHRSPVNSPHKGQWRGALMFSLVFACVNSWVNNREAGDLRRHRAHYDVIVMIWKISCTNYTPASWSCRQLRRIYNLTSQKLFSVAPRV